MMFGAPDNAQPDTARIPSIVILGADALLAALPATPIQLAHACMRVGYQHVLPSSWGDELIAAATLRELHNHSFAPAIHCSCPFVANRLLAVGPDLRPFLISLLAPPAVLARYLRTAQGPRKLRITYVGRCPGAADEAIDARLTPEELLAVFADHQIALDQEPDAFDSVIPPDRRRYLSQPGGLPTPETLWLANANGGSARTLVELYGDELPVELAQHLLAGRPVLIDVAPKLGCVCSGATADGDPQLARARVAALEPPRASSPVIDDTLLPDAALPLPASPRSAIDVIAPAASPNTPADSPPPNESARGVEIREDPSYTRSIPSEEPAPATAAGLGPGARRLSPAHGVARLMSGGLPIARDAEGRQLPRTYVALRRPPNRAATKTSLDVEARIPTVSEPETHAEPARISATPNELPMFPTPEHSMEAAPASENGRATAHVEPAVTPRSEPAPSAELRDSLTRRERPITQLLTLGLLIAMIVLVSAAIGLVVGRWMTQR